MRNEDFYVKNNNVRYWKWWYVSEIMNKLNVKNLILYHTEETHGDNRKELYAYEAKGVFEGNVIVPDDLEEIEI